ncbi:MAG TPA: CaiB/BaiF CoA-transferase family protein [Xanthobacteraceae bacterium]|nr:CaiB/BaiF CoA-transferase family protein [Xanthobacteraceae bacterium]
MKSSTTQFAAAALPLAGIKVLDFSTLLPGPLAGLLLAEAGADVVKVERPGGEDMRRYRIALGEASVNFALLNRGKRSLCLDLKNDADRRRLQPYLAAADVLIEQFRPGVMERLGFGYDRLRLINRGLIYCAITGYGQDGPRRDTAGHDLNYMAETGLLGLTRGVDGAPGVPPVLAADIGGGALPAVINILLALRRRDATGEGCQLDIAMADNLFTFAYWGLGAGFATAAWPRPGRELISGGSPRYRIYRTADDQYLAVAPIEERFWQVFCDAIGLSIEQRDDASDPSGVIEAVARRIASATAKEWQQRLRGLDACVSVVASLQEAAADPAFVARGLFSRRVSDGGGPSIPALPVPIAANLRRETSSLNYAHLGDANDAIPWPNTTDS